MTQKELLYVEDAYKHEDNIIKICNETMNMLEDDELLMENYLLVLKRL